MCPKSELRIRYVFQFSVQSSSDYVKSTALGDEDFSRNMDGTLLAVAVLRLLNKMGTLVTYLCLKFRFLYVFL